MSLSVVILAAGKGTRMKSALPKVLHPIAGKPMVQHIIDTVNALGAKQLNLVYGHGADQLQSALAHNTNNNADNRALNWCHQAEQLGTGHAVQQALPHINDADDVLILVGDAPLIKKDTLAHLLDVKQTADIALLTVDASDPTGMGRIIRNDDGNVVAIVEHKDATDAQREIKEINTGIMVMSGADLKRWVGNLDNNNAQEEYYLVDVIEMAANEGKRIQTGKAQSEVEVEGVNNRVQLSRLERAYQLEQAHALMLGGATLADPARVDVRGTVTTGQDVNIDVNVVMEGTVTLGNNVRIGPNCLLIDCDIADGTHIEANSVVQEAKVATNCTVGPYARLRPGAILEEGAKVGNFVEMKKSVLGEGSKANHFTYLGDTTVGKGANIGAGTITCNYDGVNKSKTLIGDGAFIGSNSSLVAPVSIGNNATVGAGSTVSKDVPDDTLAVARGKQIMNSSWKRPVKKTS